MKIKTAASHEEQIEYLKNKGLLISDEKATIIFLKRTNYYRLASYCEAFRYNEKDEFVEGTTFEQIKNVYSFDQKIRSILFEIVEEIEFTLRTQISYYHGSKYGSDGYLNPDNFNKAHDDRNFKYHLKTVISENKDSAVIKHHNNKYEGRFPLWVIIEYFSMGMLSRFFRDMNIDDKEHIARMYSSKAAIVETQIQCVTEIRNRLAHYSRLYNWKFKTIPCFIQKQYPMNNNYLFGYLLALKSLFLDFDRWNNDIYPRLVDVIELYIEDIRFKHIGLENNWKELLKK